MINLKYHTIIFALRDQYNDDIDIFEFVYTDLLDNDRMNRWNSDIGFIWFIKQSFVQKSER